MVHTLNQHEVGGAGGTVTLSEKQFQILVDLLTPGYELSAMMLADHKSKVEAAQPAGDPDKAAT